MPAFVACQELHAMFDSQPSRILTSSNSCGGVAEIIKDVKSFTTCMMKFLHSTVMTSKILWRLVKTLVAFHYPQFLLSHPCVLVKSCACLGVCICTGDVMYYPSNNGSDNNVKHLHVFP